jgi:hypothetical protein
MPNGGSGIPIGGDHAPAPPDPPALEELEALEALEAPAPVDALLDASSDVPSSAVPQPTNKSAKPTVIRMTIAYARSVPSVPAHPTAENCDPG